MKKTYQSPQIAVVFMSTTQMIAQSATLDKNQTITSSDGFGSRESNYWDDED